MLPVNFDMDLLPPSQPCPPPNASPAILPDELIAEVLSFLPVKSLMQLRSVCKSWKSIVEDPTFVKFHLYRSSQKPDLAFVTSIYATEALTFTICRLFENPSDVINLPNNDSYYQLKDKGCLGIVGSCNGLLCLLGGISFDGSCYYKDMFLRFWNPATKTLSDKLGCLGDGDSDISLFNFHRLKFAFGYDNSSNTYKAVYFILDTTIVRVFSIGNNVWRSIQNSPVASRHYSAVVHLSGSVILVAIRNYTTKYYDCKDITIKQFVIISLDFGTEKYTQLRPPQGFDQVPFLMPNLSVLEDCLCFSHDFEQTHFVIWQMKEFGVEESWTQFLRISYHNLQIDIDSISPNMSSHWLPLCVSKKSGTLLLTNHDELEAILFNLRDKRVERINGHWLSNGKEYVESLVLYC
ncbi:putative F-box domain, galactose oxidase/kelch, beta-propeller, kelch-type beta propeller [Medicago truncatula]|uniref:Putative F-box domain, galactose oxidase/kelch, beta-propeller, kelch-type beta propeller n=1 Tax=Medicago truncatula TaxID=3880 RepID=A0A396I487_MEDTR|nr:F-box/kelch-repeat protein At3g23880 [Medicago truncatula]RHN59611.1 putative F-box domain, galactose oxidase/kelch, beta-propeller, kelch-type beta propeller [Medicago truncatula]